MCLNIVSVAQGYKKYTRNSLSIVPKGKYYMRVKFCLNVCSGDPYNYAFFWRSEYLNRYVNLTAGEYHDVVAGKIIFSINLKENIVLPVHRGMLWG